MAVQNKDTIAQLMRGIYIELLDNTVALPDRRYQMMPRARRPGAPPPKRRTRAGCWPCKARKVKCDEARPECGRCLEQGKICDYSIRLNWEGRGKPKAAGTPEELGSLSALRPDSRNPSGLSASPLGDEPESESQRCYLRPVQEQTAVPEASNKSPTQKCMRAGRPDLGNAYTTSDHAQSTTTSCPDSQIAGFTPSGSTCIRKTATHRLSVQSLLSPANSVDTVASDEYRIWSMQPLAFEGSTVYGIDQGFSDLDIAQNDDQNAISGASPLLDRGHRSGHAFGADGHSLEDSLGDQSTIHSGGYENPVVISIPQVLEPLPRRLLDNPMNLLYFHHFISHTSACLIPHNCLSNPFRTILPQMAVRDDNLLCLLLAYSASHRSRLLRHPEPASRIAMWVQDVFPSLRHALDDPGREISDAKLASAIMLASLEIVSPTAFGVSVPWQTHLKIARQLIEERGGKRGMETNFDLQISTNKQGFTGKASSFLWSWFIYLDVLGSLSGGMSYSPESSLDIDIEDDKDCQIDCVLGFTRGCVRLLGRIAHLAKTCDGQRIGTDLNVRRDWQPSAEILASANVLEAEIIESRLHPAKPCSHMRSMTEAEFLQESLEISATNEAFYSAGMVNLQRRILGKASAHPDVQTAVREIMCSLGRVRQGISAEASLLFPMFTAGCETQNAEQRQAILARIKGVERLGLTQVYKARTLMERVWESNSPWETLVVGEFFG